MRREYLPEVTLAERAAVNWATPFDTLYYHVRSYITHDKYYGQGFGERYSNVCDGRVTRYRKLLKIKSDNGGHIPERYKVPCRKSACSYTRLLLAEIV